MTTPNETHLTFGELSRTNAARCEAVFYPIEHNSPLEWAALMAGEAGEVCNAINKLRQGKGTKEMVADELADTITYVDLTATALGIDLAKHVISKFNHVSTKHKRPDLKLLGNDDRELLTAKGLYAAFVGKVYKAMSLRTSDQDIENIPRLIAELAERASQIPDFEQKLQNARSEAHAAYYVGVADAGGQPTTLTEQKVQVIVLHGLLRGLVTALDSGLSIEPNTLAHENLKTVWTSMSSDGQPERLKELAATFANEVKDPAAHEHLGRDAETWHRMYEGQREDKAKLLQWGRIDCVDCALIFNGVRLEYQGLPLAFRVPRNAEPLVQQVRGVLSDISTENRGSMPEALLHHGITARMLAVCHLEVDLDEKTITIREPVAATPTKDAVLVSRTIAVDGQGNLTPGPEEWSTNDVQTDSAPMSVKDIVQLFLAGNPSTLKLGDFPSADELQLQSLPTHPRAHHDVQMYLYHWVGGRVSKHCFVEEVNLRRATTGRPPIDGSTLPDIKGDDDGKA